MLDDQLLKHVPSHSLRTLKSQGVLPEVANLRPTAEKIGSDLCKESFRNVLVKI